MIRLCESLATLYHGNSGGAAEVDASPAGAAVGDWSSAPCRCLSGAEGPVAARSQMTAHKSAVSRRKGVFSIHNALGIPFLLIAVELLV